MLRSKFRVVVVKNGIIKTNIYLNNRNEAKRIFTSPLAAAFAA